jgi:hypothetical protein
MIDLTAVDRCKAFINCNLKSFKTTDVTAQKEESPPVVTISRQTGAGARTVGEKLADFLQEHDQDARCPWTVFHRNLVEKVLEDHHLSKNLAPYMPEQRGSEIDAAVRELLGLHPSLWTLVHYTTDTILKLAQMGRVILVGLGSMMITRKLKNAFHVRLIGSVEKRAERVQEFYHLNRDAALEFMHKEDHQRAQYLKKYFAKQIDDPLLYHLVINTDRISYEEVAQMIGAAVLRRMGILTPF